MSDATVKVKDPEGGTWTLSRYGRDEQEQYLIRWADRHEKHSFWIPAATLTALLEKLKLQDGYPVTEVQ